MSTFPPRQQAALSAQPGRDVTPRRLMVTAGVVTFAIRNWSLWVLLREGPWGPPMRLVLGTETVMDAVERTLDALLLWPIRAPLLRIKAGWQEHQVYVWGSAEQGSAVSLLHTVLLRANREKLRPNLHEQPVPSLRVEWVPIVEVESGRHTLDTDVQPGLLAALYSLRAEVQRDPEFVLRYLADMDTMPAVEEPQNRQAHTDSAQNGPNGSISKETLQLNIIKEPASGNGTLTLAEAALLYRAFFPPGEQIDLSNLRRRFLATNKLHAIEDERPVRGREMDWRRVSRAYRYLG